MNENQQKFAAKVQELIAHSRKLSPAARKQVLEMLDATRREIVARLASINPASFTAAQLQTLKHSVDQTFDQFQREATAAIAPMQQQAAQIGSLTVSAPLAAVGREPMALAQINPTTLAIAQGYTADLITGLAKDSSAKVNATIQRAFLGGQQMTDIVAQIGRGLSKDGTFDGIFSQIGERAVSIAQNEIMRVQSMSTQAHLEDLAARHADLKKQWKHLPASMMPRSGHILADGQIRGVLEPFSIKPKLAYPEEELMFPRDPNGTPENTINCHCLSLPYFDPEDLKPTADHKRILQDLGISVSVA